MNKNPIVSHALDLDEHDRPIGGVEVTFTENWPYYHNGHTYEEFAAGETYLVPQNCADIAAACGVVDGAAKQPAKEPDGGDDKPDLETALLVLDSIDEAHFTQEGKPNLNVLNAATGKNHKRGEVDAVLTAFGFDEKGEQTQQAFLAEYDPEEDPAE